MCQIINFKIFLIERKVRLYSLYMYAYYSSICSCFLSYIIHYEMFYFYLIYERLKNTFQLEVYEGICCWFMSIYFFAHYGEFVAQCAIQYKWQGKCKWTTSAMQSRVVVSCLYYSQEDDPCIKKLQEMMFVTSNDRTIPLCMYAIIFRKR